MQLSIITLGHVHAEDLTALTPHFERIEQLVLDIPPRDPLTSHRAEFNRAVDASSGDWILIVRERERVSDDLAKEIAADAAAGKAKGFRIRVQPTYAGRPLRLAENAGEIRLFNRRSYMRFANKGEWQELTIQGTVVRLHEPLRAISFDSAAAHRAQLEKTGVPHSWLRHVLVFIGYAFAARTLDGNTLRYLWVEAAFDSSGP